MKTTDKIWRIWLSVMAIPIVVLVRLLRPILLIRFGELRSSRLGHFAANTENYLCRRDMNKEVTGTLDIFYYNAAISNYQLKKMWDRTLKVWSFAKWIDKVNRLIPGCQKHMVPIFEINDTEGLFRRMPAHISFTSDEEYLGKGGLRQLGIPAGTPFVCFHARCSSYLSKLHPGTKWDYHNYRDSNIKNYILAAEELTRRRYYVIRMGAAVKDRLTTDNPMIIDYATAGRDDFLDVFLSAKCAFFIGSTAGVSTLPWIFRCPMAWANYIPVKIMAIGRPDDLFIPKKLWLKEERRFLTFYEIFSSDIGSFLNSQEYERAGIEVIENTPEEIAALVVEMDERLKGRWKITEEDELLQRKFRLLYRFAALNPELVPRIGAEFLRQNQHLLQGYWAKDKTRIKVNV